MSQSQNHALMLMPTNASEAMAFAEMVAGSTLVPKHFRGQPGAVLGALDLAARMGISWVAVMQGTYAVHDVIVWKGQYCFALVQQALDPAGRRLFADVGYEYRRDAKAGTITACRVVATRPDGAKVPAEPDIGWVTWEIVQAEGWDRKDGSKWRTMPEQMFRYRAASWFMRSHCPGAGFGLLVEGEPEDIAAQPSHGFGAPPVPVVQDAEVIEDRRELTVEHQLAAGIEAAPDVAALKRAGREVDSAHKKGQVDEAARKRLLELYKARNAVLTNASGSQGGLPV